MDFVLRSNTRFALAILVTLSLFTVLFQLAGGTGIRESFYAAFRALFGEVAGWSDVPNGAANPIKISFWLMTLNCTAAIFGLFNFGILVSHLYSRIVRK